MKKQIKKDPVVENTRNWGFILGLLMLASVFVSVLLTIVKEFLN